MSESTVPALATSKRKFYKLLDGLNSSTSMKTNKAKSTATLHEPASKRSRVSLDGADPDRPSSIHIVGSRVLAKTRNGTVLKASTESQKVAPNYQPYSQERFLERLKTFSDVKIWTYKPSEISEVEWAKRGWVCEKGKVDTVACKGGCEARVVVRLERGRERVKTLESLDGGAEGSDDVEDEEQSWRGEPDEELVKRYQDLVVDGHKEGCLWKTAGCKDDIYRIRMADASIWQTELMGRYEAFVTLASSLPERLHLPTQDDFVTPNFNGTDLARAALNMEQIQETLSSFVTPSTTTSADDSTGAAPESPQLNVTAATLALFGWQGTSPHNIHLATCDRCFQRIGLWLYTSNPSNKAVPASQSGIADDDIMRFDLTGLHREYCPWINAESQMGLGSFKGLAAWEILVELIKSRAARGKTERRSMENRVDADEDADEDVFTEKSHAELDKEDKERESRLARIKRAFTVKKSDKKENRKSWRSLGK